MNRIGPQAGLSLDEEQLSLLNFLYEKALASLCYSDEGYLALNPKAAGSGLHPFVHCVLYADKEDLRVSELLHPRWYREYLLRTNKDANPLIDFFTAGLLEGSKGAAQAFSPAVLRKWTEDFFAREAPRDFLSWPWEKTPPALETMEEDLHVLFVLHESTRTGAPLSALRVMRELQQRGRIRFWILDLNPGEAAEDFAGLGSRLASEDVREATDLLQFGIMHLARGFAALPLRRKAVIINSLAVPKYLATLFSLHGLPVLPWVHELPKLAEQYCEPEDIIALLHEADTVLFTSKHAQRIYSAYAAEAGSPLAPDSGLVVGPAVVPPLPRFSPEEAAAVKKELGIEPASPLILGCGPVSYQKGVHHFTSAATAIAKKRPDAAFVWVGKDFTEELKKQSMLTAARSGASLHFVGEKEDMRPYFAAASLFLFTASGESLGLAALEAKNAGLDVICYEDAGGVLSLLNPKRDVILRHNGSQSIREVLLDKLPPAGIVPPTPEPADPPLFSAAKAADVICQALMKL